MLTLHETTAQLIKDELESIPEKYHKAFNSTHEGYAIMLEEVEELKEQIFFGEKKIKSIVKNKKHAEKLQREAIRAEAVQVAAMACRIIQELT